MINHNSSITRSSVFFLSTLCGGFQVNTVMCHLQMCNLSVYGCMFLLRVSVHVPLEDDSADRSLSVQSSHTPHTHIVCPYALCRHIVE